MHECAIFFLEKIVSGAGSKPPVRCKEQFNEQMAYREQTGKII
jgi:hypothetical protein